MPVGFYLSKFGDFGPNSEKVIGDFQGKLAVFRYNIHIGNRYFFVPTKNGAAARMLGDFFSAYRMRTTGAHQVAFFFPSTAI